MFCCKRDHGGKVIHQVQMEKKSDEAHTETLTSEKSFFLNSSVFSLGTNLAFLREPPVNYLWTSQKAYLPPVPNHTAGSLAPLQREQTSRTKSFIG